jgi:hypothetical protein|tara:strand:+ start:1539 stop:1808 length:270 start_codon:yes stop_codon:yes gene_type:complete
MGWVIATPCAHDGILAGAWSGRGSGECLDVGDRWFLDHQMRQMIRYNIISRQPFSDEAPHLSCVVSIRKKENAPLASQRGVSRREQNVR